MATESNASRDEDGETYPSTPLPKLITFRLSRLQARVNAQAGKILKKHANISLSEWRILVMIEASGKTTPAQIVRTTSFDKGLVSRTVKRMQERGLISVAISETDGRSHVIDFTPEGRSVFLRARPAMRARQEMFRQSLAPAELETLFLLFDKLDLALEEMDKAF